MSNLGALNGELAVLPKRLLKIPAARWSSNVCKRLPQHFEPVLADFTTSQSWFNGLTTDIYIKHRDGTIVKIKGQVGVERTGELICLTNIERFGFAVFDHESHIDYGALTDNAPLSVTAQADALLGTKINQPNGTTMRTMAQVKRALNTVSNSKVSAGCRYTFKESDFRGTLGTYLSDLDVVITTTSDDAINTIHPQSYLGLKLADGNVHLNDRLSFSMFIIDNEHKYKDRFTTIHDMHFKVPTITDISRPDGLYIVRSGNADDDVQHLNIVHKFHSVDEADRLNITRTKREYESADRKALNESLEQVKLMQGIINSSEDRKQRNDELERKLEDEKQKRLDAEQARIAAELRFDRDMAERVKAREEAARVNRRKDYIEYFKLGLSAVGVAVSLGVKFKKA